MMGLIQNNTIKLFRCKLSQIILFVKRLHHSKDIIRIIIRIACANNSHWLLIFKYFSE